MDNLRLREHGVECDLLEATTEAPPQNDMLPLLSAGPFYTWFSFFNKGSLPMLKLKHQSQSLEASLKRIMWYIARNGPYDGLFGFSQGAVLVTALSSAESWRGLFGLDACPWEFCICGCAGGVHFLDGLELSQAGGAPPVQDRRANNGYNPTASSISGGVFGGGLGTLGAPR